MSEGLTELQVEGFVQANELFDDMIDNVLYGREYDVDVSWGDETDDIGEPDPIASVTINGESAEAFFRQSASFFDVPLDEDVLSPGAIEFADIVARSFHSVIDHYQHELPLLYTEIESLVSSGALYYAIATAELLDQRAWVPSKERVKTEARGMVRNDLAEWANAVEDLDAEEEIKFGACEAWYMPIQEFYALDDVTRLRLTKEVHDAARELSSRTFKADRSVSWILIGNAEEGHVIALGSGEPSDEERHTLEEQAGAVGFYIQRSLAVYETSRLPAEA